MLTGAVVAAHAAPAPPTPDSGPTTGGTRVELTAPDPSRFTQISGGSAFSVALDTNGFAYAWGENNYGQLGNATYTNSETTPVRVHMPAGVTFTQISSSSGHSLALGSNGKVYAWGKNNVGQLGNGISGDYAFRNVPVEVAGGLTFTQVSAGSNHSLALDSNGKAYAWGANTFGGLGLGTSGVGTESNVPVAVSGGLTFTQIDASAGRSLALDSTGKAYAWGWNHLGQLGDNTTTNRSLPTAVAGGLTFTQISSEGTHSLALTSTGAAYAWGSNSNGELGDNTTTYRRVPVAVSGGLTFTQISAGAEHSLAVTSAGKAYAWGRNDRGQLGDNTTTNRRVPTAVSGGLTVTRIGGGNSRSYALDGDGKAYAWGWNTSGALGDGTTTDRKVPTAVVTAAAAVTNVTFGGTAGTGLTHLGGRRWEVTTPAHAAGPVDIVMRWTLGGVTQPVITFTDGFTYVGPEVEIEIRAYQQVARTTEIPRGSVLAPGTTLYWKYTIVNTGAIPVSIRELRRDGNTLAPGTVCLLIELAPGATTTCTAQSTV